MSASNTYEMGKEAFEDQDYERALEIMLPLAQSGHPQAQVAMGLLLDKGYGLKKDENEAFSWYLKAAQQGIPIVQHQVAFKYLHGVGVEKNYQEAARWWEQSAEAGLADSQFNLGLMYYRGLGIKKNYQKAIHYFQLAAEQHHGNAQYSLAVMHAFGQSVEKNYQKAIKWFLKAANSNIAQAQFNLGVFYENGYGVAANQDTAKIWYQKAANQGLTQAKEKLAQHYKNTRLDKSIDSSKKTPQTPIEPTIIRNASNEVIGSTQNTHQKISGTHWVLNQPSDTYTLQIASSVNEKDIVQFLREQGLNDKATYAQVMIKGIKRYSAFYGRFNSFEDAKNAIEELPQSIQKAKPWVRNFGILKKLLSYTNDNRTDREKRG